MSSNEDFRVIAEKDQRTFQSKVRAFLKEGHEIKYRGASTKQEKFVAFFFYVPKGEQA